MTLLTEADAADLAVVAFHDGDNWSVRELPDVEYSSLHEIEHELRRFPDEAKAFVMLSLYEDCVIIARVVDAQLAVVLSDITAASNWQLARAVTDHLGLVVDQYDEDEDQVPAGDLAILAPLGMSAPDLAEILDDPELYPDEVMSAIAEELGFGELFDEVADLEDDDDDHDFEADQIPEPDDGDDD